jgi:hypothetical protein
MSTFMPIKRIAYISYTDAKEQNENVRFEKITCISHLISTKMRCRELVTRVEDIRNVYKILVVKSEGKRPLEDIEADWRQKLKLILNHSIREAVYLGRARFSCLLNAVAMSELHE